MGRGVQRVGPLALLGLCLLIAGCMPKVREIQYPETGATLEGTVSYGKEKVEAAMVIAQNDKGSSSTFLDENGRYKLENVPLGEVNIAVDTEAGKGQATGRMVAKAHGRGNGGPRIIDVPKQFADPATSGIKTTINKGSNEYDIKIPK
jgi:hypothetical protein